MSEVAGRLEQGTLLTVEQCNLFDIVQRELSQVYLSVLCITQLHTVVRDAQMVCSHRPNVDGLDATYATIVLQL